MSEPSGQWDLERVLNHLQVLARPEVVGRKAARYGIRVDHALGIYQKDLQQLARKIGRDRVLAESLFDTGIYEARLLCARMYKPGDLSPGIMDRWVATFSTWEICDAFSMHLFARASCALEKIKEWTGEKAEYVKRAGFVMIAGYSSAHKQDPNQVFRDFFPIIQRETADERHYVKKAISWALRSIGKRNEDLRLEAIKLATYLQGRSEINASWVGRDVLRELEDPSTKVMAYPRTIYSRDRK
jgi:3-methyladenine DNA glycosylase AlkD